MKNKLGSFFRRWPRSYDFMKRVYSIFRALQRRLLGTKLEEGYWVNRHLQEGDDWGDKKNDWVRGYWDSRHHSHRNFLIERISKFSPSSILEIGSNCGPNLYLLARRFPDAKMMGVDINPVAVQEGNEWFTQEGMSNVQLLMGKADNLRRFQDRSFDVVFTDAVLIYIGPDKIRKVVAEMLRVSRKALILLEWNRFDPESNPLGVYAGHWIRDYAALLKEFVSENRINVVKIPEESWTDRNWQQYGTIIEAVM